MAHFGLFGDSVQVLKTLYFFKLLLFFLTFIYFFLIIIIFLSLSFKLCYLCNLKDFF